jgi:hypothetical protein
MWNWRNHRNGFILVGLLILTGGCSKEVPPAVPSTNTTEEEPAAMPPTEATESDAADPNAIPAPATDGAAAPATEDQSEAEMIRASFASLSAADREAATKQRICPVTDAALGTMGTPIKVSVAGQEVFICCEHCEEPLKAESTKYLAKIGLKPPEGASTQ